MPDLTVPSDPNLAVDDLLRECIRLASRVGDGDASVSITRRKADWNVLAFFNLTLNIERRGTLGYVTSAQHPSLSEALLQLKAKLEEFLEKREAALRAEKEKERKDALPKPGERSH